jgi:hypothetical protein
MRIWEVDPTSHWVVLDFYASNCEKSEDLTMRMIGLYLRGLANNFEKRT